jgi:hypothetical protein
MVTRDGASTRKERLQLLIDLIKRGQHDMTETKMKGIFMLQTGLTRSKVNEYFQDLVDVDIIERKNGHVKLLI